MNILKIDHIGIRILDKNRSIIFYESLGFELLSDSGFEQGHPIMMRSASGVVLNLLGPAKKIGEPVNILMDNDEDHAGYTHMALKVESINDAESYFESKGCPITGRFEFKDMKAIFIRDPDRNVIEFDEYSGDHPETRLIVDEHHHE